MERGDASIELFLGGTVICHDAVYRLLMKVECYGIIK